MYRTLFELTAPAMVAWLVVIFFPKWRVTRRVAESAVFPAYLAALYAVGVVLVLRETGPGIMADFGSADGVLRLLRMESVAIVAWIHILAFDQVVALLIYRDNMRNRFVPLPVQSVLLLLTLMFGPLGFLAYWLLRTPRARAAWTAWGERDRTPMVQAALPTRFDSVVTRRGVAMVGELWSREVALVRLGVAGFALAAVCAGIAVVNGGWLLGAEGRLFEAAKFDLALGFYWLTLALILPLAGFPAERRTRWVRTAVGLSVFAFAMENVQSWRGLDPRFSDIAGPIDQALGGLFFLSALGITWLFIDVTASFFRRDALPDHPLLRNAFRYAACAAFLAFGVGIVMSIVNGRFVNGAGNLMPVHAAGFHGLQAVPLVALLLGWSALPADAARRVLHAAGAGWLLLAGGLTLQAFLGLPPAAAGPGTSVALTGVLVWMSALALAWRAPRAAAAVHTPLA